MRTDPDRCPDGRCAQCRKQIRLTRQARKYAGDQLEADPFCSRECCARWHRVGAWKPSPDGRCVYVTKQISKSSTFANSAYDEPPADQRCPGMAVAGEPHCVSHRDRIAAADKARRTSSAGAGALTRTRTGRAAA